MYKYYQRSKEQTQPMLTRWKSLKNQWVEKQGTDFSLLPIPFSLYPAVQTRAPLAWFARWYVKRQQDASQQQSQTNPHHETELKLTLASSCLGISLKSISAFASVTSIVILANFLISRTPPWQGSALVNIWKNESERELLRIRRYNTQR